jgi:hypothetical protein
MAISKSGSVANKLSHCRLPLPFVNVFVVLQPSGVERVLFPCRAVVEGPAVGGSLKKWVLDPTIGCRRIFAMGSRPYDRLCPL